MSFRRPVRTRRKPSGFPSGLGQRPGSEVEDDSSSSWKTVSDSYVSESCPTDFDSTCDPEGLTLDKRAKRARPVRKALSAVRYADKAVLFQNPRKLLVFLDNDHLTRLIEYVDDVGFTSLKILGSPEERSLRDSLYKIQAFGSNLSIHYRVVIDKIVRFWLSRIRRAMLVLNEVSHE